MIWSMHNESSDQILAVHLRLVRVSCQASLDRAVHRKDGRLLSYRAVLAVAASCSNGSSLAMGPS